MLNMELLKQLYSIHALTFHEWPLICFIREYISLHVPEAEVRMDSWGNLYIKKGEGDGYPTLTCHLDQVQTIHSGDFCVKEEDGKLYGWSETNQQREGLGADDKNGIYICLRCLEECPRLKVFMAIGEEKGCIGSNRADMSFFTDSLYVLEPDCKGGEEIHTNLRGVPCASEDFNQALQAEVNGFTITDGKTSDIFALTLNGIGVSCANIPAGYHLPHKDDEYTVIAELEHTLSFIRHFITTEHHRFPHIFKTYTQQMIEGTNCQLSIFNSQL
jgi:putative aminopeptidase FrvX